MLHVREHDTHTHTHSPAWGICLSLAYQTQLGSKLRKAAGQLNV